MVSLVASSASCFLSKSREWWDDKILDYFCSWNRCHLSCDRYFKYNLHSLNTLIRKFPNLGHILGRLPLKWVPSWAGRELGITWSPERRRSGRTGRAGVRPVIGMSARSKQCGAARKNEHFEYIFSEKAPYVNLNEPRHCGWAHIFENQPFFLNCFCLVLYWHPVVLWNMPAACAWSRGLRQGWARKPSTSETSCARSKGPVIQFFLSSLILCSPSRSVISSLSSSGFLFCLIYNAHGF